MFEVCCNVKIFDENAREKEREEIELSTVISIWNTVHIYCTCIKYEICLLRHIHVICWLLSLSTAWYYVTYVVTLLQDSTVHVQYTLLVALSSAQYSRIVFILYIKKPSCDAPSLFHANVYSNISLCWIYLARTHSQSIRTISIHSYKYTLWQFRLNISI